MDQLFWLLYDASRLFVTVYMRLELLLHLAQFCPVMLVWHYLICQSQQIQMDLVQQISHKFFNETKFKLINGATKSTAARQESSGYC